MPKLSKSFSTILNVAIALSLAFMAVLVFGNVVLRYLFNSGITWSEEMSRFLFVWMVFLGAIAALKDKMHLGMDLVVNALPKTGKTIVFFISNGLILYVLWLFLDGSWKMTLLNMNSKAPATGMPLSYMYGIGIITSIAMAIIILFNIWQVLFSQDKNPPLVMVSQSEDVVMETVENVERDNAQAENKPFDNLRG